MVTIGGLPVYEATVPDDETGMFDVSLVDEPAVMSDFLAFKAEREVQEYRIQDEEKRLVYGVVARADFPILRRTPALGEFYIVFRADTIRRMAEKYLADGLQGNVSTMHRDEVDGVQMVQWFIKDTAKGVAPEGFDDIADGSLFAEFHVLNDDVWASITAGDYRGFSLAGAFEFSPEEEPVAEDVDGKFASIFQNVQSILNRKNMSKINRFKAALAKLLAAFGSVSTDKGVLSWDGEEDLKAGDEIYVEDQDGNRTPAPDGDYVTTDGKTIVVADGKVSEIRDPEAEVAPEPEADEELRKENAELRSQVEELTRRVEELSRAPMAKPAHEEVKDTVTVRKTGIKGLDRLAELMSK